MSFRLPLQTISLKRLNDRNIRVVPQPWQDSYLEKLWRARVYLNIRSNPRRPGAADRFLPGGEAAPGGEVIALLRPQAD